MEDKLGKSCRALLAGCPVVPPMFTSDLGSIRFHLSRKTASSYSWTCIGDETILGLGPYLFSPGWLSMQNSTSSQIPPTRGINPRKHHQPLLPISCSLLTCTASPGMITASSYRTYIQPYGKPWKLVLNKLSSRKATIKKMRLNRTKNQYSFLRALPLKTVYFFRAARYQFRLLLL